MTQKRFKHAEIRAILKEAADCQDVQALCDYHGITLQRLRAWQKNMSKDSPQEQERSRVITPGGYKPKTKSDFYNENLRHFQHISVDY